MGVVSWKMSFNIGAEAPGFLGGALVPRLKRRGNSERCANSGASVQARHPIKHGCLSLG
jgi:hypothetical protein